MLCIKNGRIHDLVKEEPYVRPEETFIRDL